MPLSPTAKCRALAGSFLARARHPMFDSYHDQQRCRLDFTPTTLAAHRHKPTMASPPSGLPLTKKRPSISGPLPPNPSKRRKPSTGPSGLRQTSFPPEESGRAEFSRSPSVDSTFTANTNTTKKKGRKGKGGDDDGRSTTGTSVRGGKAGAGEAAEKADEEDEADQDEGGETLDAVMEGQGEADEKQEKEHLRYAKPQAAINLLQLLTVC